MDIQKVKVLLTKAEIEAKVKELAQMLSRDYSGKNPLFVCVLKGAAVFLCDLIRHMDINLEVDFMAVSSYGNSTTSSGVVRILKDLEYSIEDRHVIIVEDIIDTGLTLDYLRENLLSRRPASLKIVALLDKPERRTVEIEADYRGFSIPDEFVVGYGLDFKENFRNLPDVCVLLEFG